MRENGFSSFAGQIEEFWKEVRMAKKSDGLQSKPCSVDAW